MRGCVRRSAIYPRPGTATKSTPKVSSGVMASRIAHPCINCCYQALAQACAAARLHLLQKTCSCRNLDHVYKTVHIFTPDCSQMCFHDRSCCSGTTRRYSSDDRYSQVFSRMRDSTKEKSVSCRVCASENQSRFLTEIAIHLPGLSTPHVFLSPQVVVCMDCGSTEFSIPETELARVAKKDSTTA